MVVYLPGLNQSLVWGLDRKAFPFVLDRMKPLIVNASSSCGLTWHEQNGESQEGTNLTTQHIRRTYGVSSRKEPLMLWRVLLTYQFVWNQTMGVRLVGQRSYTSVATPERYDLK